MTKKHMRLVTVYLPLFFIVSISTGGCFSTPERLQPSGMNSSFQFDPTQPFDKYVEHYRSVIKIARHDLDQGDLDLVVSANQPFELSPDQDYFPKLSSGKFERGIVLTHGLSESPYHMRSLAEYFRERGFLTRVVLLPGHGTKPGDMIGVSSEDWRSALNYGIDATRPLVEKLYLGGFSTGGTLSVLYASEHPDEISGLFLYSPCLKIKTGLAWLTGPISYFKTWLDKRPDRDYTRYESFAFNAAAQIYSLTEQIDEQLLEKARRLPVPTFIALSMDDETVDSVATLDFFTHNLTNQSNRLLLFTSSGIQGKTEQRIIPLNSRAIKERILSFSHLSITIPPDDAHYGVNGDYRNCLHYRNDSANFNECSSGENNWYGERNKENLSKGILQRITWNPLFAKMLHEQDRFLANLP